MWFGGLVLDVVVIKTIGELIKDTRCTLDITLTQLSEMSGIPKGTISRIEKGDVKRPEFQTVHPLAVALNISLETLLDYYVEIEKRAEHLMGILQISISDCNNINLIKKVAEKYLEANEDSIELTERLYRSTNFVEDIPIKLSLYCLIIDYSRSHGIMPYIAKGMYQKYLIERNDFSKLKETYYNGKYILHYVDFLPQDERTELYYKLGIHAYNLNLYHESIEHCKHVLHTENPHKVNALGVLRDAYFSIGEYKESEIYAVQYKQFNNYPHARENIALMEALYAVKKGDVEKAVQQLTAFLETCSNDSAVLATNQLLQIYLQKNDLISAKSVLENSKIDITIMNKSNPFVYAKYADFFKIQGEYYLAIGDYCKGIDFMLQGAFYYSKVSATSQEKDCLSTVMRINLEYDIPAQTTFEKLNSYYKSAKDMEG